MKIIDNTDKLLADIESKKRDCLATACAEVESTAKEICVKKTGDLANSITSVIEGDTGIIGSDKDYAPIVEIKYHPFLRPALEQQWNRIKEIFTGGKG